MTKELPPIDKRHRYIIRDAGGEWVSSTDNLGIVLASGFGLIDTIGEDGLGTMNGNRGIGDFLRARRKGRPL